MAGYVPRLFIILDTWRNKNRAISIIFVGVSPTVTSFNPQRVLSFQVFVFFMSISLLLPSPFLFPRSIFLPGPILLPFLSLSRMVPLRVPFPPIPLPITGPSIFLPFFFSLSLPLPCPVLPLLPPLPFIFAIARPFT